MCNPAGRRVKRDMIPAARAAIGRLSDGGLVMVASGLPGTLTGSMIRSSTSWRNTSSPPVASSGPQPGRRVPGRLQLTRHRRIEQPVIFTHAPHGPGASLGGLSEETAWPAHVRPAFFLLTPLAGRPPSVPEGERS